MFVALLLAMPFAANCQPSAGKNGFLEARAAASLAVPPTPEDDEARATALPATTQTPEYDVVIVGAGLMGSTVAARLAEELPSDYKILVLEAGKASQRVLGGDEPPASVQPDGSWQEWMPSPGNVTRYDVPGNYPVLQCWSGNCEQAWQDLPAFQCKILGGCGVMNGALTQMPQRANFNSWPAGWRWENMISYLQAAKDLFHITQAPSADGQHYLDDAGADFVRRALSGNFDENAPHQPRAFTMGKPFVTAKEGVRQSTASELLPAAILRPNLELMLGSLVTLIEHNGAGRATAVRYIRAGQIERASLSLRGIVVLSGGAMNTPRLLLASGVAPDNLAIGRNISDHTYASAKYRVPHGSLGPTFPYPPLPSSIAEYSANRTGGLTQFGPLLTAFWRSPDSSGSHSEYDVEMWVQPSGLSSEVTLNFALMRPTCSSADVVLQDGKVLFQSDQLHLGCERDRDTMRQAKVAFEGWMREVGAELEVGAGLEAEPMNHWVGSCALERCVDVATLLLHGSDNVAVADASILPGQVWGHPALTLQAVALRVADLLWARFRR